MRHTLVTPAIVIFAGTPRFFAARVEPLALGPMEGTVRWMHYRKP
jgi:hypothetical protein